MSKLDNEEYREWVVKLFEEDEGAITGGFDIIPGSLTENGAELIIKGCDERFAFKIFIQDIPWTE